MSRPYVNINSSNYNSTTDVVTLDITALRLRGQSTLTIGGFTSSQTISLSDGYYANSSFTFSANINGTSSIGNSATSTFSPAKATFVFTGTAYYKTNVKITLWPGSIAVFGEGGYTFSATMSNGDIATALNSNVSNVPAGVTSSVSGTSLIFTAPTNTGAYYNGNKAFITSATPGTLGFTFSSAYYGGTWSGGVTTLTLPLSSSDFGTIDDFTFDVQ